MLPRFGWQAALTHWEFAPVVTAITAVIAALYLWGAWRVARRHPARPWPWWRTAFFLGGLLVIVLATESGIGAYDELFWVHMIQHLMLIMIAPPLLVLGQPVTLLLHASRNPLHTWTKRVIRSRAVTIVTWPPVGFAAYAAVIVATHLTGLTTLVLTNQSVHDAEHALYLVAGYLFFLPIFGREPIRWRISYPVRFMLLVLIMPVDTFTGLVLGSASTPIQGLTTQRPPGSPSPLQDVHWAGAIMWVGGDAIMLGFMMLVFLMWAHSDGIGARSSGGWLEAVRTSSFETLVRPAGPGPASPATSTAPAPASDAGRAAGPAVPAPAAAVPPQGAERASAGTIDDDEHLDAYNAYLARLNQPGHGPAR